jgi:hypothetical protein
VNLLEIRDPAILFHPGRRIMNSRITLLAAGECACLTKPIDVKGFLKMVAEERG